ncbi:MAG: hypothetical protein K6T83_10700 [Alicyclobacillus sp.]|nr:hypothetical protein [Alicyclobacillus sp.]
MNLVGPTLEAPVRQIADNPGGEGEDVIPDGDIDPERGIGESLLRRYKQLSHLDGV